jgi:hypothetical protein
MREQQKKLKEQIRIHKERKMYWANMLKDEMAEKREYTATYEALYDYGKVQMENALKPIKEYYYANPLKFDVYDPHLMHKAKNKFEAKTEQKEKFALSTEHDQALKIVFKEVEAQKREI